MDNIINLFNTVASALTIRDVVVFLISLAFVIITAGLFLRWFLRQQWRIYKNLKREVMIISDESDAIGAEIELLKRSKLFKINSLITDPEKASVLIINQVVVVLAYKESSHAQTLKLIDALRAKNVPLIIYTQINIDSAKRAEMNNYSLSDFANSPLRLMNLVFNIAAVMPNAKKSV